MNLNDMLLLTNPAGLAAVLFGLIACAGAMLAKGILQPQRTLSPRPIPPLREPQAWRDSRA
jgi:hypothetical protein